MLKRISVKGFKSLSKLDLELAQVNVLIGPNGSGKSNILEAIGLLSAAAGGRVDDQALLRRGVRPGTPSLYKTSLRKIRLLPAIYLEGEWNPASLAYAVGLNNPLERPQPAWRYKTETLQEGKHQLLTRGEAGGQLGGQRWNWKQEQAPRRDGGLAALAKVSQELSPAAVEFLDALGDFAIFAPVTPILRGIAPDPAPRNPVGLFGGRLPEAIGPLLDRKAGRFGRLKTSELFRLLDWANDVSISPPSRQLLSPSVPTTRFVIRFGDRRMASKRNQLTGYDASEGALYVLFALVLAMHPESPRILAVDNYDAGLNPLLAKEMTRIFIELLQSAGGQRQVFLTTHQPQVLDGLNLADERIGLFAVERDRKSGQTMARRIRLSADLLKKGGDRYSLSRLWTMGRLGAVPEL